MSLNPEESRPGDGAADPPDEGPHHAPPADVLNRMGRFDQSFFVRMTVGFLILTLVVAALEVGLRFAGVLWDFHRTEEDQAQIAARELADDVRSIMLNRGGPVASRTVYPILERNFRRAGFEVAVEPSEVTVTSIEQLYDFVAEGIPADWPDGTYNEGHVELRAERFCLACHIHAEEGDVLGTVTVREYLDTRLDGWLEDLRLTATLNLATAGVHTIILFLLLRTLMAPLLSLRSAVARLGLGTSGLRIRAQVVSSDEFGELAHNLNGFLDRVTALLEELRRTTRRTVALNERLTGVTEETRQQVIAVEEAVNAALPEDEEGWARAGPEIAHLPRVLKELHHLRHHVQGIESLEERLDEVAGDGKRLLDRLLAEEASS